MGMETSMEFGFERLKMWQKSRILVKEVYRIVSLFCYDEDMPYPANFVEPQFRLLQI